MIKKLFILLILGTLITGCADTPNFGVHEKSQVVKKYTSMINGSRGSSIYVLNWTSGRGTSLLFRPSFRADIDFADVGDYIICSNGVIMAVKCLPKD